MVYHAQLPTLGHRSLEHYWRHAERPTNTSLWRAGGLTGLHSLGWLPDVLVCPSRPADVTPAWDTGLLQLLGQRAYEGASVGVRWALNRPQEGRADDSIHPCRRATEIAGVTVCELLLAVTLVWKGVICAFGGLTAITVGFFYDRVPRPACDAGGENMSRYHFSNLSIAARQRRLPAHNRLLQNQPADSLPSDSLDTTTAPIAQTPAVGDAALRVVTRHWIRAHAQRDLATALRAVPQLQRRFDEHASDWARNQALVLLLRPIGRAYSLVDDVLRLSAGRWCDVETAWEVRDWAHKARSQLDGQVLAASRAALAEIEQDATAYTNEIYQAQDDGEELAPLEEFCDAMGGFIHGAGLVHHFLEETADLVQDRHADHGNLSTECASLMHDLRTAKEEGTANYQDGLEYPEAL